MNSERIAVVTSQSLRTELWEAYLASFQTGLEEAAQIQICFTEAQFYDALLDPEYTKCIVYSDDGKVAGCALASKNLDKAARIAYANPWAFERKFPEMKDRIFYFPAIYIRPEYQGHHMFVELVTKMIGLVDEHEAMAAFDVCSLNDWLPEAIAAVVNSLAKSGVVRMRNPKIHIVGTQTYVGIQPTY